MARNPEAVGNSRRGFSLQASLALLVMFATMTAFYASGFLSIKQDYHSHFGVEPQSSSSLKTSYIYGRVSAMQMKVGKGMEEIQLKLAELSTDSTEDAIHELKSLHKQNSNLLLEVAATLDIVNAYLLIKRPSPEFCTFLPSNYRKPNASQSSSANLTQQPVAAELKSEGKFDNDTQLRIEMMMTVEDEEKDEEEWPEEEEMPADVDPLVGFFEVEEMRRYLRSRVNRLGRKNFMGANATFASIGHACVSRKYELEKYMEYEVGDFCPDDWPLGQKLMVHGCDPLPRRRCFSRGPKMYTKPPSVNESLWKVPQDENVRWDSYMCKSFECLGGPSRKGFFKCGECFDLLGHERPKWTEPTNLTTEADFMLEDVLELKPGEIRIGLDFSVGVGTFAARMKEHNITIASATLNLGAPFNEIIALRGLLPLYLTPNQRLPFFDNTLDIIHTTLFLDGWIDHQLLDFILFDWDRCLRPGGLLWIDRFFSKKEDMDDYLYYFEQMRYKRWKWVVTPKIDKDESELWFSAVLEKPVRPI
ncbi:hypothetical protein R1flu_028426 [Riccia fluitans]|uniref:S-adenosyl-L-methionine-dependent methyltransferase n=1 Tax=Riccia fluitans TaxID=41844 RepID=A0ABD1XQP6_9MARC